MLRKLSKALTGLNPGLNVLSIGNNILGNIKNYGIPYFDEQYIDLKDFHCDFNCWPSVN